MDTLNFDYIIMPEIQEWAKQTIHPTLVKQGLKKLAIVTSNNLFSKVSIRQMIDKFHEYTATYKTRYFADNDSVMAWISN